MTQSSPTMVGMTGVVCSTLPSCTLVRAPMTTWPSSPRSTALGHTDDSGPMRTSPMTTASGCTYAEGSMVGSRSPSA